MADAPLIVTLTLDEKSQQFFNALRKANFPPERNYLDAHLTLFHHLPPDEQQVINDIAQITADNRALDLPVTEVKSIGAGVVYKIESPLLQNIHLYLQQRWQRWLTPQDKNKLWPHITVQNKVPPEQARLLTKQLQQEFKPFMITGTGLSLFEYQGGPWKYIQKFDFLAG
jgi:hypothetical protein